MPDGDMRRPPQLWEQKLSRVTSILGVGIVSGDGTSLVDGSPTPGDGGTEPSPTEPAPEVFKAPSTPTLSGTVQGIRVSWDGTNVDGDPYPAGAYVEVHISTASGTFTPSSSTLAGTLLGAAGFFTISALTAGTTYYVRLVGVDQAGNRTAPSSAASSQTGLTTSSDYGTATIDAGAVSFDARAIGGITTTVGATAPTSPVTGDIWLDSSSGAIVHKRWSGSSWVTQAWGSSSISAGAVTATQIAAGAITAGAIAANAVTADKINASAVTADKIASGAVSADKISANAIDGKTITGAVVRTSSSGTRVELSKHPIYNDSIAFFNSSGVFVASLTPTNLGYVLLTGDLATNDDITSLGTITTVSLTATGQDVFMQGVYNNNTTGIDSVGIGSNSRLRRISSSQEIKYDITPLAGDLSESVEPARIVDANAATVEPRAVLDIAVTEFSVIDRDFPEPPENADEDALPPTPIPVATDRRVLGFIADDVADKLPIAVTRDETGKPAGVLDTAIVASLLAVVKEQQTTIENLTARIEALEGA